MAPASGWSRARMSCSAFLPRAASVVSSSKHPVEMVLDHPLVAPGDEDEMLDAGLLGLVDHVLNQRLVDDRQHFLRHCLGGGQDAGAEAGDREDGFTDFHGMSGALISRFGNEESALIAR
ncbi:hypothetical protein V1277_002120 [Bradyrhizobium sp. AZCC 1588]